MKKKRRPKDDRESQQVEQTDQPEAAAEQAGQSTDVQAERDDLLDRLQRVSADYLNYQKRVTREMAEARQFANAELIKDLLGVLDDMERALEAARANHAADDPLLSGMQLVYDKALEVLARHGLERIAAAGEAFDPNRHEAMMQQPAPGLKTPTVLDELQRGYELKGRVIRPARVIVGMPASPGGEGDRPAGENRPPESE